MSFFLYGNPFDFYFSHIIVTMTHASVAFCIMAAFAVFAASASAKKAKADADADKAKADNEKAFFDNEKANALADMNKANADLADTQKKLSIICVEYENLYKANYDLGEVIPFYDTELTRRRRLRYRLW